MVREAVQTARTDGYVGPGDIVVVLAGVDGSSPATDVLRVVKVPEG
jgi:pyruvate kinase